MCRKIQGQITVFLALCSGLLLSVFLAEIETARYFSIIALQKEAAAMTCASMLAQYNIPLYEMYSIFGVDGHGRDLTAEMEKSIRANAGNGLFAPEITAVCAADLCSLADENYEPLMKEMIQYMKTAGYIDMVKSTVDDQISSQIDDMQSEKTAITKQLQKDQAQAQKDKARYDSNHQDGHDVTGSSDGHAGDADPGTAQTGDPRKSLTALIKEGLLKLVLPADFKVSEASLSNSGTYETYKNQAVDFTSVQSVTGQMNRLQLNIPDIVQEKSQDVIFFLYAKQKFKNALSEDALAWDTALSYELEYIICGHQSDNTNLLDAISRIVLLRTILNISYLLTDASKTASAHSTAAGIAASLIMPWMEPVIYSLLLMAWAYGEAIIDVRLLMQGGKVALFKTAANWQLSLNGIASLTPGDVSGNTNGQSGLTYEEYLMILWAVSDHGKKAARAVDLMEANIRLLDGYAAFSMEDCFYGIGCITEYKITPLFSRFSVPAFHRTQMYQWSECY